MRFEVGDKVRVVRRSSLYIGSGYGHPVGSAGVVFQVSDGGVYVRFTADDPHPSITPGSHAAKVSMYQPDELELVTEAPAAPALKRDLMAVTGADVLAIYCSAVRAGDPNTMVCAHETLCNLEYLLLQKG